MQKIEIRVKGNITDQRSGGFDGLNISYSSYDETVLTGIVSDQAALYGVIAHLRDLGLQLSSVSSEDLMDQNPP
ncbi:MAG: hypothetical protein A2029_12750 [Chloroflexi bacterium RBG_19FT_COMBO_47_9]|nr:MAG: hypothetical protein A2029_12750 [Chloroflexi bacterium RBG_19FT_COMBO_47_9]